MNYIELIRQFWQCNNEIPIGCNATALYFYLLKVCNSLGWKETFKHSDRYIALQLGIAINTVRGAKNRLKQLGLIDFKSPEKSSKGLDGATRYSLLTLSNNDSVPNSVSDTDTDSVPDTRNKHKLNKTKQEEIYKDAEDIYSCYPGKCIVNSRSTGKCQKNKEKITRLLKTTEKELIMSTIQRYIEECRKSQTYMMNFSTFLNNLPDYSDHHEGSSDLDAIRSRKSGDKNPAPQ